MLLFGMSYICLQIFQLIGISHTHFLSYNPKSKEIYFVSASFKRSKSFLFIQIFQVLVIYLGLIFADYSNKIFAIVLFLVSISEMLKLVYLKKIVNKEINKETNMPYKLTDVISRLNIYSRIIFIIVLNTFVNFLVFK